MFIPSKKLIRVNNDKVALPDDLVFLLKVINVGKLKNRSKWLTLFNVNTNTELMYRSDVFNRNNYYMRNFDYIMLPKELKSKALVIEYCNLKQYNKYCK